MITPPLSPSYPYLTPDTILRGRGHKNKNPTKFRRFHFMFGTGLICSHGRWNHSIVQWISFWISTISRLEISCCKVPCDLQHHHTVWELKLLVFSHGIWLGLVFWTAVALRFNRRHVSLRWFLCGWGFNQIKVVIKTWTITTSLKGIAATLSPPTFSFKIGSEAISISGKGMLLKYLENLLPSESPFLWIGSNATGTYQETKICKWIKGCTSCECINTIKTSLKVGFLTLTFTPTHPL